MDDDATPIATIAKNSREEMRVRLAGFHGKTYADLRIFADKRDASDRVPTGKGIAIAPERLTDVITGLEDAKAELIRRGILRD